MIPFSSIFVLPKEKIAQLGNDLFGGVPAIEPCHVCICFVKVFLLMDFSDRILRIFFDPMKFKLLEFE